MRNKAASRKPPSRARYEETHRVFSARLGSETGRELEEYLHKTGCSFADFVKGALEKEKEMVAKRVEILASRQTAPSVEERLRCLEDLVHQIYLVTVDTYEFPPLCPYCEKQELCRCEGREMESKLAKPWVIAWKCPKCSFFINTYKRIDPKSIEWLDLGGGSHTGKPKASARSRRKKSR